MVHFPPFLPRPHPLLFGALKCLWEFGGRPAIILLFLCQTDFFFCKTAGALAERGRGVSFLNSYKETGEVGFCVTRPPYATKSCQNTGEDQEGGKGISKTRHLSSLPRRKKEKTKSGEEREKKRKPLSGLKQRSFLKSCLLVSGLFFPPCVGVHFCVFVALPPGFYPKKTRIKLAGRKKEEFKNRERKSPTKRNTTAHFPPISPFPFRFLFRPFFRRDFVWGGREVSVWVLHSHSVSIFAPLLLIPKTTISPKSFLSLFFPAKSSLR